MQILVCTSGSQLQAILLVVLLHTHAVLAAQAAIEVPSARSCKQYPGDDDWPTLKEWRQLNQTVRGSLIVPQTLATVCRPQSSSFDNTTCSYLTSQWMNTSFIAENSWMSDYNDVTCPPNLHLLCTSTGYPAYVIEEANAADVQAGVNFARQHDLRLVIKGTGHDYPGRSAGSQALSIWTHKLQGIEILHDHPAAFLYGGIAAVKIAAGHRWGEVYAHVESQNLFVVGGADPNVGVGGWYLNGGHSPLSSKYGLGADQILAVDVVTADGQLKHVNEKVEPDLFWALRGGSSTFGVAISFTVKAYPPQAASIHLFNFSTAASSATYWNMVAYHHTQIVRLSDAGGMGYVYALPGTNSSLLAGILIFPDRDEDYVNATMRPVYSRITDATWANDPVEISLTNSFVPNLLSWWLTAIKSENAGTSSRIGSWLLDESALSNQSALFQTFKTATAGTSLPGVMISHIVAGQGVRNSISSIPGGSNAVLPAWRDAYVHAVIPVGWETGNAEQKAYITAELRERLVPAFKMLAPLSGAYLNEADPSDPAWKNDYFGTNYDRLLDIKHRYDPDGVLWCKPCVGWDELELLGAPSDEDPLEWGIGQGVGKLCRKT